MNITHLKYEEINKDKWDKCIHEAYNGIIYAYSWYLDIVCDCWEGLVVGDYHIVMPLTGARKYYIYYLYQPFFTQQLGVFSTKKLSTKIIEQFIKSIPQNYRFIEINLNSFNRLDKRKFDIKYNITYQLDLISRYDTLFSHFSKNTIRNLKKALNNRLSLVNGLSVNELINFTKQQLDAKAVGLKLRHYNILRRIVSQAVRYRACEMYAVFSPENELCAAAVFLMSHNKSIMLVSASNETGKQMRAMFLIVNQHIKNHAESNLTLDFEGSNIEGIARFYRGFGAIPCEYTSLKINRLPWYMKILKK